MPHPIVVSNRGRETFWSIFWELRKAEKPEEAEKAERISKNLCKTYAKPIGKRIVPDCSKMYRNTYAKPMQNL